MEEHEFQRRVSGSLLRLRAGAPFFAALVLFARISSRHDLPTAATDGRDVWINPAFMETLSSAELDGLMLHEVLHAALLHVPRRGMREPLLWNVAADIVINGIIAKETKFVLPRGALRDSKLEAFSVEEVYELLMREARPAYDLPMADLLEVQGDSSVGRDEHRRVLETYWRHAREQATMIAQAQGQGTMPAGLRREWKSLEPAQLDWRSHLWRFLVRTPVDFQGYDRRFIGRGLYLEALEGESLRVFVAVDTSGSVSSQEMGGFLGEVQGILAAYPHIECDLYYVDVALHGPHRLTRDTPLPQPVGGGGTDFRPFFSAIKKAVGAHDNAICVYLTDGYGIFPKEAPESAVLWVVISGGLEAEGFPFGESVRLLINA
jgi:predicted metal-dependent peptidase